MTIQPWPEAWNSYFPEKFPAELEAVLERDKHTLCPPRELLFRALELLRPEDVRVVILGQDPYHTPGKASGLAFGYHKDWKEAPNSSLLNIANEIRSSTGEELDDLSLESWASQGVLLLNTRLSTTAHQPLAHAGIGWFPVTLEIIKKLSTEVKPIFLLWGGKAGMYEFHISPESRVLKTSHPCAFSAHVGFIGCGHFGEVNKILKSRGRLPIRWGRAVSQENLDV